MRTEYRREARESEKPAGKGSRWGRLSTWVIFFVLAPFIAAVINEVTPKISKSVSGLLGTPELQVRTNWPARVQGCDLNTGVAMPSGGLPIANLDIDSFDKDPRALAVERGAVSWDNGVFDLTLGNSSDEPIHIASVRPHVLRKDKSARFDWVLRYTKGCGGGGSYRALRFNLDRNRMVAVVDDGTQPIDSSSASMLSGLTVTKKKPARLSFEVRSCRALYEWAIDIDYNVAGELKTRRLGPYSSAGGFTGIEVFDMKPSDTGAGRDLVNTRRKTDGSCAKAI